MEYYDYGTYSSVADETALAGLLAGLGAYLFLVFAISIFMLICFWILFKKAGKGGWEILIPIYNIIVLLDIVKLPLWYIILLIIPFANIYAMFKIYIELAHKFNQSTGFGVATVFFGVICIPILALSKECKYVDTVKSAV